MLDVIIRQHCEAMNREEFLESLKHCAKKLKAYSDGGESKRDSIEAVKQEANQKSQAQTKSKVDKDSILSSRDRLISAMLIEPEVLHLIFCFQHQFRVLFNCYSSKPHMQFTDFWQFCVDFQFTPRFITEQQLRRAYDVTECFSILAPRLVREPPRHVSKVGRKTIKGDAKLRSKAAASPMPSVSSQPDSRMDTEREKPERERHNSADSTVSSTVSEQPEQYECETSFGANAFTEALCRVAFLYLGFYGSILQQSSSSYFKITWLLSYLRRMSCLMLDHQTDETAVGAACLVKQLPNLWDDAWPEDMPNASSLLQPQMGPGNKKPLRRRSKQQSMAPRLAPSKGTKDAALSLKKQKTLSNIREAVKNLGKAALVVKKMTESQKLSGVVPRKLDDSSSEEEIPPPTRTKLAQSNTETKERIAALTTRMAASLQKPTKKQIKKDSNIMPVEDLFKVEAGKPAVLQGICQLCGKSCEDKRPGNPACRGCSIVDSIHMQAHPFARLMYDSNPYGNAKILRPKAKAQSGERLRAAFRLPEAELLRSESLAVLD